jgi:hypothetical protein
MYGQCSTSNAQALQFMKTQKSGSSNSFAQMGVPISGNLPFMCGFKVLSHLNCIKRKEKANFAPPTKILGILTSHVLAPSPSPLFYVASINCLKEPREIYSKEWA